MLKKIDTLLCQVQDMNRSVAFYRDVLQLTPGTVSPYWSDFEIGGIKIGLHPPFVAGPGRPEAGWILGFEVEDLAKFKTALVDAKAKVGDYHDVPGGVIIEFEDPDGNHLQAVERGVTQEILKAR